MGVSLKGRIRSFARRAIGSMDLTRLYPPMDYVSNGAIFGLGRLIGKEPGAIRNICVVGVHNGDEVSGFLKSYPNAQIHLYEPSSRYIPRLERIFGNNPRIKLRPVAASNQNGRVTFYETNAHGAGSLLEVGETGAKTFGLSNAESSEIDAVRLDDDFDVDFCDCLWIDVQGAEHMVLQGAIHTLAKTSAIHIEVSTEKDIYTGDSDIDEITDFLREFGFRLALLGLEGIQGNAFYVRHDTTIQI